MEACLEPYFASRDLQLHIWKSTSLLLVSTVQESWRLEENGIQLSNLVGGTVGRSVLPP